MALSLENLPLHVNAVDLLLRFAAPLAPLAGAVLGCIGAMAMHATFASTAWRRVPSRSPRALFFLRGLATHIGSRREQMWYSRTRCWTASARS